MNYISLGKTRLLTSKTSCCISIPFADENTSLEDCFESAYESGVNFFDITESFLSLENYDFLTKERSNIILSTTIVHIDSYRIMKDFLDTLNILKTDSIDILFFTDANFHFLEDPNSDLYKIVKDWLMSGKVKYVGLKSSNLDTLKTVFSNDIFSVVQMLFDIGNNSAALDFVKLCEEKNIGLMTFQDVKKENLSSVFCYLHQFDNLVTVWKTSSKEDILQISYLEEHPFFEEESKEN